MKPISLKTTAHGKRKTTSTSNMMNISGPLHLFWFRAVHTFYFSKNTLLAIMSIAGFKHFK